MNTTQDRREMSQLIRRVCLLVMALPFLIGCPPPPPGGGVDGDLDNDGLPDRWEREQRELGLSPMRANLILVPVILPSMTREDVQANLDSVVDFFARMPNRNPDGSTGIGVIVVWGNLLPEEFSDARALGMPAEMIGRGHGVLIGAGGGGRNLGRDWSVAGNNWRTIVHELGHQLGLAHDPLDTGVPSPLYTSIMNYDYSYQFNGDPNAVHFSTGKFRSVRLDERNLDETLPFPISDLQFLSGPPHHFELRAAGPTATHVDFNRNGVPGERGIRANINSGSSVWLSPHSQVNIGHTAGGFTLTAYEDRLVSIYSDVPRTDYDSYSESGLSPANPGNLKYRIYTADRLGPELTLTAGTTVTGDPHAIEAFGRLFVAVPQADGYQILSYGSRGADALTPNGAAAETRAPGSHVVLVRTTRPEQLHLFAWDESTRRVRHRQVNVTPGSGLGLSLGPVSDVGVPVDGGFDRVTPLLSNGPVGATWNPRWERIEVITTDESRHVDEHGRRFDTRHRMRLNQLGRMGTGWVRTNSRWLTHHPIDWAGTTVRPTILFDGRSLHGEYLVYFRRAVAFDTGLAWTDLVRLDLTPRVDTPLETPYRGTKNLMGNQWVTTRSAPAAAFYRDDVVFGWRLNEIGFDPGVRNLLILHLEASGIGESNISDFDDVTHIATRGLRESLAAVRR